MYSSVHDKNSWTVYGLFVSTFTLNSTRVFWSFHTLNACPSPTVMNAFFGWCDVLEIKKRDKAPVFTSTFVKFHFYPWFKRNVKRRMEESGG